MLLKITLKCMSLRVVLDLLNQISNVDAMWSFHCRMWYSWNVQVNVLLVDCTVELVDHVEWRNVTIFFRSKLFFHCVYTWAAWLHKLPCSIVSLLNTGVFREIIRLPWSSCTSCAELAHSAHSFTPGDAVSHLIGSITTISIVIHGAPSLTRFSLSTSTCSSLSFPSTSSTPSCTLSFATRSSWKACATPPTRWVRTPATSPPPSQVMSPTTWPSASSTTHRFPSPS